MTTHFFAMTSSDAGFAVLRDAFHRMDILNRPEELLEALGQMPLILASIIVAVGALCILNGYKWHKWVIVVLAFLAGLGLGHMLSAHIGKSAIVVISLGFLCAIIATPLLKMTVAVFGGITGAFIGANLWSAFVGAEAASHWVGALMGFILLAMTSLVLFRLVIVLFTSIGGAAMVVLGAVTILLHIPAVEETVRTSLLANPVIIPLLLVVAAVSGFVLQESRIREARTEAASEKS